VPKFSSNYDIFDYDIPLYQLVVQGLIPNSTKPLNASADSNTLRLLALSTGTSLHYDFMYANPSDFADSDYKKKFYGDYRGWVERAANEYKLFKDIITDISDRQIISHTRISEYEFESVFDGGKTIFVNTDTEVLTVNGVEINLNDYGLYRRWVG